MDKKNLGFLAYDKSDEHIVVVAKNVVANCQNTMQPVIDRAHARIDTTEERLTIMDNPEVGKVTVLWRERNKVIAIGGILLLFIILNLVVGIMNNGGSKIDKTILREAIKDAIQEIKP
jgi:hypothetical protein